MIFELLNDFADALRAMPNGHPRRRILDLLHEAVRRDVNFIDRHTTTLFQCLWNSCWWYDTPAAAAHYEQPEPTATIVPPWTQPGGKLYSLLELWRDIKRATQPRANWIRDLRPPRVPLGSPQAAVLCGHASFVKCLAVSLDGRLIASGSDDVTVRIWETETGEELRRLPGESSTVLQEYVRPVHAVALSPVAPLVASGARDGKVRLWDLTSGRILWVSWPDDPESPGWVTGVAFSADGEHLFCNSTRSGPQIRKVTTGEVVPPWSLDPSPVITTYFSADGRRYVYRDRGTHEISIYNSITLRRHCVLQETGEMAASALAANGAWFCAFLTEGSLCVWDAETGRLRRKIRADGPNSGATAITDDGRNVASAHGWEVRVWDVARGEKCKTLRGHAYGITGVGFIPEPASTRGPRLVSSSDDCTIRLWDINNPETLVIKENGPAFIQKIAYAPNGRYVASVDMDGRVTIWDPVQAVPLHSLTFGRSGPFGLMFSRTGRHLYIKGGGAIHVWRTMSRCPARRLRGAANDGTGVALSNQWRELWRDEMGAGIDEERIGGGWASAIPGIPFGPYSVRKGASEMEIRTRRSGDTVGWHPGTLYETAWHPSGRSFGGREGNRLCLFQVEGPTPEDAT